MWFHRMFWRGNGVCHYIIHVLGLFRQEDDILSFLLIVRLWCCANAFALKSKQINGVFCAYQLDYVMVFKLLDQGAYNKVLVFVYF